MAAVLKNDQIHMRDPFVLPVKERRCYYLFGTTDKDCWDSPGVGFDYYIGEDLCNWRGPFEAFRPGEGFWGEKNFWAPEVHRYKGRFFMCATFYSQQRGRGTALLVSDSPGGPFEPWTDGPVTPRSWECLDGTLWVEQGQPWMVFCHEWVQVGDGRMCAVRLSDDLRQAVGEPVELFRASQPAWVEAYMHEGRKNFVNDGPFLWLGTDGELFMIWSSFDKTGYAIGVARSKPGQVTGPWVQQEQVLYAGDGGHGMIFETFEGDLKLALHRPNSTLLERPVFLDIVQERGNLRLK